VEDNKKRDIKNAITKKAGSNALDFIFFNLVI
jgi:hypothetical protein